MILRNRFREFTPIVLLFIVLNALFISGRSLGERWDVSTDVLLGGNLLLFLLTFFSFLIAERGLQRTNPHAFVRAIYTSILMKLFIGMIAAFIYIAVNKQELNKPALFTVMGLYLVYSFLEVGILTRMLKSKKDE